MVYASLDAVFQKLIWVDDCRLTALFHTFSEGLGHERLESGGSVVLNARGILVGVRVFLVVVGLKRAMSEDSVVWKKIGGSKWAVGAFWAIPFWWWPSFLWSVRGWKHAQSGGAKQQE